MVLKTLVANSKFGYLLLFQVSTDLPGLLSDVLRHNQKAGKVEWKVLVVDRLTIKILSSSIKISELNKEGITREYLYGTTNNKSWSKYLQLLRLWRRRENPYLQWKPSTF